MTDAMLVIDVVNTFEHEDADALLAAFRRRLAAMVSAIAAARSAGTPIIYVNDANGIWDGDAPARVRAALQARGGDVVAALAPEPGDWFLFKPHYSAFDATPLALVLESLGVDRLVLTGAATEGCVVQTGIDARELGLKATILRDACATTDAELEALALAYAERVGGIQVDDGSTPATTNM